MQRIFPGSAVLVCLLGANGLANASSFAITNTTAQLNGGTQNFQEVDTGNSGLLVVGHQESFGIDQKDFAGYSAEISVGAQLLEGEVHALGPHGASISGSLSFNFKLVGPQDLSVPVTLYTPKPVLLMHVPSDPFNQNRAIATAQTNIQAVSGPPLIFLEQKLGGSFGQGKDTFLPALHFNMVANQDIGTEFLSLALATVGVSPDFGQVGHQFSVSGSLDPYFTIDPSFADAASYAFDFSPGVGNGSPVPVPASLWSLAGGLLALVGVRRRRASELNAGRADPENRRA